MKFLHSTQIQVVASIALLLAVGASSLSAAETAGKKSFVVKVTGHGSPMILIPGLSSSGAVWNDTVAHYKDRYECHVLTLAGFAGQPRIDGPLMETVRKDLAAYITAHKMKKPIIVGHSLGGFLALWLAAQNPDLVGPLVIVDSLPFLPAGMYPMATVDTAKPFAEQIRSQVSAGGQAYLDSSEAAIDMMVTKPKDHELVMSWVKTTDPVTAGNAMYELFTHDLRDDVAKIKSPTLVLGTWAGSKDFASQEEMQTRFKEQYAKLKGCKITMSATRHFIMLDDAPWFLKQCDAFLAKPQK